MQSFGMAQANGNGAATNGAGTGVVIAAQSGKTLRVFKGAVAVSVAATGAGGLVRLCDGTTTIMEWPGDALGGYTFDFSPGGYPLTLGNALQLIVSGAATTQASARCAALALVA